MYNRQYSTRRPTRETRPPSAAFLELIYRMPRPALWNEDYERALHRDLPRMTADELAIELSNVWRRITIEKPALGHWLWQRRAALFAERDRRWGGRR